jgi:hypothetical protein
MLDKRADILEKLDRHAEVTATLEAELAHLRGLPAGQKKPALEKAVEERLAKPVKAR